MFLVMKKKTIMNWVLATTLVCGSSVSTSCSSDNDDNPAQEQAKKNRKEFIEHTRATLKDLAENLNFTSWESANDLNLYFNQCVLNNPEFNRVVVRTFFEESRKTLKPVEEGSELAEMGYKQYGTVDFSEFNYRFTMNADYTTFNVEAAEGFELIMSGYHPATNQWEEGIYKLTLAAGGDKTYKLVIPTAVELEEPTALIVIVPSEFRFAISANLDGTWRDTFTGTFNNKITVADNSEFVNMGRDNWEVSGTIGTDYSFLPEVGRKDDITALNFDIIDNRVDKKREATVSWEQNGRKMFDLSVKESGNGTGGIYNLDLSQFTSASSIFDVIGALLSGGSIDEGKLTLLDDLTTTFSVTDMPKVLQLTRENANARRHYADQQTIDQYTQQLNELVKAEMTCKGVNQTIPGKLVTTKFGVDWWSMPAFKFADEDGYVTFTDLLDSESVTYGINIIDHAAAPMSQSIIVMRQLLQYLNQVVGAYQIYDGQILTKE